MNNYWKKPLHRFAIRVFGLAALPLVLSTWGCSDGGNGGGGYGEALQAVEEATRPRAAQWADSVADEFLTQLEATGSAGDYSSVLQKVEPETTKLNEFICDQINENKDVGRDEPTATAPDAEAAISPVVDEAVMTAIARHFKALKAIGMNAWGQYPPFVLKEPAPSADTPVPDTPEGFREYVKPEFVDEAGGLKLPSPGSPSYQEFQLWYGFNLQNKLLIEASAVTGPVRGATKDCLADLKT